ncbi:MAG: bifunctional DNA primase/polymerase [Chloroflexi bacterium]|nr:bifunctional DNA primase/polymerase [Chloroflexota bacterium]
MSGIVVIDADTPEAMAYLTLELGHPHILTPRGGHWYFKHPGYEVENAAKKVEGIDWRGDGGFVNLIGKRLAYIEDGVTYPDAEYQIMTFPEPGNLIPWEKLPTKIKEVIERDNKVTLAAEKPQTNKQPNPIKKLTNAWHSELIAHIGRMRARGLSEPEIETLALALNHDSGDNPLPDAEVIKMVKEYEKQSKVNDDGSPKVYPYTDLGNAERLYAKFGNDIHWVTERKLFVYWDGHTWVYDTPDDTYLMKLAKATIRDIVSEPDGPGKDGFKDKIKHALTSESSKRQRDMIALVKSEGNVTISIKELDSDIYLFNCKNATVDLRTGKAREQRREDLITITAPVEHDETATCPKWDSFLNLIQKKIQGMITYLQTLCGYCLTGDTKTDIIPFCHGCVFR